MASETVTALENRDQAPQAGKQESHVPARARIRIEPTPGWRAVNLHELWRYRELFYFLAMRDLKVRYKQTVIGIAWAVIQPLFTMIVFTLFFGMMANLEKDTGGIPYPVFSMAALVPWTFFATSLASASNSVVASANMLTKVYFPRLIIPGAAVITALVDFAIAFVTLLALMLFYHTIPPWTALLTVPLLTVLGTCLALGLGLWLSALLVEYRDIRLVLPFVLQIWMFLTPVIWPLDRVPERYRLLVQLNPMTGVIQGYRSALLGQPWDMAALGLSVLAAVLLLITGAYYFRRMERSFADIV